MKRTLARLAATGFILILWVTFALAAQLPTDRTLTIQLSSIDSTGQATPVSSTTTQTDAQGKFTFSFPTVPSSDTALFLLLQVYDGSTILRQTIIPAPENGGAVEAGISEVSDLQARALLSASTETGRLTPVHFVLALVMIRTTAIPSANVPKIVAAINAAADAFYASLYAPTQVVQRSTSLLAQSSTTTNLVFGVFSSHTVVPPTTPPPRILTPITGVPPKGPPPIVMAGMTPEQVAVFDKELLAGLRRTMSLYRKSIDDSSVSDTSIEAHGRFDAIALMMRELISASATAGIPLDVTEWAYLAAGGAAEDSLEQQGSLAAVKSLVRMCFTNGMILYQAFRTVGSHSDALSTLGVSPPTLQRYFKLLNSISTNIPNVLRGIDVLLANPGLSNAQQYEIEIFNMFATRDLAYMHAYMDSAVGTSDFAMMIDTEYDSLLANIINRMAASSGVMNGMTKERLQTVMGAGTANPIGVFILPVWLHLILTPQYTYSPILGLSNGVANPPVQPLFDQLSGAYLAQAQQQYDIALTQQLNDQDNTAAENASAADFPPRWISLSTAANLKSTSMTRREVVRSRMSGISEKEKNAIITITNGMAGYGFF